MATSFLGQGGLPLGLRNNNPGDFRTGIAWQGITGQENGFLTFSDVTYGLRALALDLINNISKEGYDSIRKFITKFAPPSENDTDGYIAFVSRETGIGPDDQLGTDQDTLHSMMRAIMDKELGSSYSALVGDDLIDQGIAMASGGGLTTLPDAVAIAVTNPAIYVESASPTQWAGTLGVAAGLALAIYLLTKK
jgi:hypothetical protein